MVELQHDGITFATVHAGVREEVIPDVLSVARDVAAIPVSLRLTTAFVPTAVNCGFARLAVGLKPVATAPVSAE